LKRHHNTLYVTTQGSYLTKDGESVLVRVGEDTRLRVPIHNLEAIVCFGNVLCSPFLLGLCGERRVHVSFLTEGGRFHERSSSGEFAITRRRRARRGSSRPHEH
jgi:CRISPR-associated protein Cas1